MNTWVLICNTNHFDAPLALEEKGYVYWSMRLHFELGDIAYIYVTGKTAGRIKYKVQVEDINIPYFEGVQKSYLPSDEQEDSNIAYAKLRLLAINDNPILYFEDMKAVGEKLCMIKHFKLNQKPRLLSYIQKQFL